MYGKVSTKPFFQGQRSRFVCALFAADNRLEKLCQGVFLSCVVPFYGIISRSCRDWYMYKTCPKLQAKNLGWLDFLKLFFKSTVDFRKSTGSAYFFGAWFLRVRRVLGSMEWRLFCSSIGCHTHLTSWGRRNSGVLINIKLVWTNTPSIKVRNPTWVGQSGLSISYRMLEIRYSGTDFMLKLMWNSPWFIKNENSNDSLWRPFLVRRGSLSRPIRYSKTKKTLALSFVYRLVPHKLQTYRITCNIVGQPLP